MNKISSILPACLFAISGVFFPLSSHALPGTTSPDTTLVAPAPAPLPAMPSQEAPKEAPKEKVRYVEITKTSVNLRKMPRTGATVFKAPRGMIFPLLSTQRGCHELRMVDGSSAYITMNLATLVEDPNVPEDFKTRPGFGFLIANNGYRKFSLQFEGDEVVVEEAQYLKNGESDEAEWVYNTYYWGILKGNEIIISRSSLNGVDPESGLALRDNFETKMDPVFIYYSPTKKDFVIEGEYIQYELK